MLATDLAVLEDQLKRGSYSTAVYLVMSLLVSLCLMNYEQFETGRETIIIMVKR